MMTERGSEPSDQQAARFPVSVKGIVVIDDKVILLKNERDEWELPGGKLDPGESPIPCVVREVHEELGLQVDTNRIIDAWVYNVLGKIEVVILTYGCRLVAVAPITISHEHKEVGLFAEHEIPSLPMPSGYKESIRKYFRE
jgi:8-oxo-dGTP pyrophosphatase MutT (NUDIX family)